MPAPPISRHRLASTRRARIGSPSLGSNELCGAGTLTQGRWQNQTSFDAWRQQCWQGRSVPPRERRAFFVRETPLGPRRGGPATAAADVAAHCPTSPPYRALQNRGPRLRNFAPLAERWYFCRVSYSVFLNRSKKRSSYCSNTLSWSSVRLSSYALERLY